MHSAAAAAALAHLVYSCWKYKQLALPPPPVSGTVPARSDRRGRRLEPAGALFTRKQLVSAKKPGRKGKGHGGGGCGGGACAGLGGGRADGPRLGRRTADKVRRERGKGERSRQQTRETDGRERWRRRRRASERGYTRSAHLQTSYISICRPRSYVVRILKLQRWIRTKRCLVSNVADSSWPLRFCGLEHGNFFLQSIGF